MDPISQIFDFGAQPLHQSFVHSSPVPDICKDSDCILGVDEAGRGPVLGPMVYAVAYCPVDRRADLKATGVNDSKQLSESQRENHFVEFNNDELKEWVGWSVHSLSALEISNCMLRKNKYNLNALAHDTTISLIRSVLDSGARITEIYVDTVGPPDSYQRKLSEFFPGKKIIVAKKADSLYPVVSAASICAKVIRDGVLTNWRWIEKGLQVHYPVPKTSKTSSKDKSGKGKKIKTISKKVESDTESDEGDLGEGQEVYIDTETDGSTMTFGSGYPADPNTKAWLQLNIDELFGFPNLIRFSWGTCEKILDEKCLRVDWPEPDEISNQKLTRFFIKKRKAVDIDNDIDDEAAERSECKENALTMGVGLKRDTIYEDCGLRVVGRFGRI